VNHVVSQPVFRTAGIRAIEARTLPTAEPPLMERAGAAVAAEVAQMLAASPGVPLIVVGPGNNGGDGFVAARRLKEARHSPVVVFAGDGSKLPADARVALQAWRSAGGEILDDVPARPFALAVDALFGVGLARPLEGRYAERVDRINALRCPVLSVDIPSGLDSDTGQVLGRAVQADRTLTFIALKPGLLTLDGPDHCGDLRVDALGLDVGAPEGRLVSIDLFRRHLKPRLRSSHKGSFGSAGILGGAPGMAGAALLAGRSALKLGAGRVYVGMLERLAVDPGQPELMLRAADEIFSLATALAVGPGLGQSSEALELLHRTVEAPQPLVVDADALNLLAEHPVLAGRMARREAATILTPHPAEAARLLVTTTEAVQADRLAAALELARRSKASVALKGCGTIVATPAGRWFINGTGNPGLASGGTGDLLTGIIVALLAQGWPALKALLAAIHLHGAAADALVAQDIGPVGLTAGELIDAARSLFNRWIASA
jgi:hydroxyethylthiazole kinase-like uncharacterized protein yjeF